MKKILLFIYIFLFSINIVNGSTYIYERTSEDLGVNKKWVVDETNINNIYKTPRVNASEKIYDFAQIILDEEESILLDLIKDYIDKTNMDMVILTTDLQYNEDEIETYATDFYDYNDFGLDFNTYSGILIVRNINSYNKYFNIYTFGKAQLYYSFERIESILDYIYSDIANDKYLEGYSKFINKSMVYYESGISNDLNNYYIDDMGYIRKKYSAPWGLATFLSLIVTFIIIRILVSRNKMIKKEIYAKQYMDRNSISYSVRSDKLVNTRTTSHVISNNNYSSRTSRSSSRSRSGSSRGGHGRGGGRRG